jgi:hypothetical protein
MRKDRAMEGAQDSLHSSQREALLEHLFIGEVMRVLWLRGICDLEVLKPQVDDSGYDLVLEAGRTVRHVQLKATKRGSSLSAVNIHRRLADKANGCVVLIEFDPATLKLGPFYWFGSPPGEKLPRIDELRTAKHTKANASGKKSERPNIRRLPHSRLERVDTIEDLIRKLFGENLGRGRS